ncbi:CRISPR-associated endonuclease Cas1 [Heliobacillus mobilis]|uniref:CRISPR-associated endonuclease Cas1 n=1 Tax=Heliobacterium mobile TaxID=28064 RepID=A0A6I3SPK3_HELMO|nr:CRISPR-associated endonuclease Cas1 [Heliobacterium mobile]MTV50974.1 CRISPR-associated endonuclease Cas1 [Heliobacterium mobile]
MTDEYLWPARNVAEYAYCPRLFYLMEVEGLHLVNVHTEEGMNIHRKVDKPSRVKRSKEGDLIQEEQPKSVRSFTVRNSELKLMAIIDLVDIDGNQATPIEYRKGRPRRKGNFAEPWPTERVQVGLQALLLEQTGYEVKEAQIYYAREKMKLSLIVDTALKDEALEILEEAKNCAKGSRPLPLVNDERCSGCSLQPLCLPNEINYERLKNADEEFQPRKVWPPCDEGIQVVVQQQGTKIGVSGMSMRIKDAQGTLQKEIPLTNVESVSLLGSVQISTQAVQTLSDLGIPIAYLSPVGRLIALIDPLDSTSAEIRRSQVRKLDDPTVVLELSKALIIAKIANQRTLLMRNNAALPENVAKDLKKLIALTEKAKSVDSVRGYEGQAASLYFRHFAGTIKDILSEEFQKNGRVRRPALDPINACLSFAYTNLTNESVAACRLARLEPSIGALHVSRPGRPALALDLMEPFRPLIADSIVISAFNRGELGEGHFIRTASGCLMTDFGRRAFYNIYARRMDTLITHPTYGYRLSYRRMLILHARMIAAWLMGEIPDLSFLTTR